MTIHPYIVNDEVLKQVRNGEKHSFCIPLEAGEDHNAAFPPYKDGDVLYLKEQGVRVSDGDDGVVTLYKTDGVFDGTHFTIDHVPFRVLERLPAYDMPRSSARFFLMVKEVGVRLLSSEEVESALDQDSMKDYNYYDIDGRSVGRAAEWHNLPYVWVVSFDLVKMPARFLKG